MPPDVSGLLDAWVAVGWLRPLDGAFAEFLKSQAPETPDLVLLMAALTSYQLGRGHICLDLDALLSDPEKTLSWPPEDPTGAEISVQPPNILKTISLSHLVNHLEVSPLVSSGPGNSPLVLGAGLLYLRRYWEYTQTVAQHILNRLPHEFPIPDDLENRLDALFEPLRGPGEKAKTRVHWQSVAAAVAAKNSFSVISGGPGTGKTTTVVHLLALLQQVALEAGAKLRIRMAAPTGKAAARLTESLIRAMKTLPEALREALPREVTTLHRLLGSRPNTRHFLHHLHNPLHLDLLVVDEASMMDLEIMAALLSALPDDARLILLGDRDQLASVEAGAVLGDICQYGDQANYAPETTRWIRQHTGYNLQAFEGNGAPLDQHITLLRKNHRFGDTSGIGALSRAVNNGNPEAVEAIWSMGFKDIHRLPVKNPDDESLVRLILDGYRPYLDRIGSGPGNDPEDIWLWAVIEAFGAFQLLSPLRKGPWGVSGLNEKTADILFHEGLIDAGEEWYPGRPVMITRNDYHLGLMNGDTGIVLPVSDDKDRRKSTVKGVFPMAGGSLKKVMPSRLNHVETAYALTVHKSQGSEFDHTAFVLPDRMTPVLTRELLYTAITRSRACFTLVSPRHALLGEAVKRRTYRASGLGRLLRPKTPGPYSFLPMS
ncbi:MAG: exodeoxyribonuclease V subunit alpha [Deltaproteobacteria bacterium]|nr:exodeoxyribonuclease V subunit alpha [Deltaproteobacteria bacterium]